MIKKKLRLVSLKIEAKVNKESSGRYLHNFYVTWKKNPKNNYVDFIAHRYTGTLPIGNYYTELIYEKDGISHESPCSFSHDCTRITNIDDGWIGAFQLPSQYEKLYAYSSFSLLNNTQTIKVYSTYQHAQKKTTLGNVLNTAKADPKGLGGVVTLGNVVNTYFDQMQGISITI